MAALNGAQVQELYGYLEQSASQKEGKPASAALKHDADEKKSIRKVETYDER